MAVVQISRIQVRRGQKNQGSGLPQLASGELGWAIDTRELFIGNGAVSEGAPAVGNTKVLTEYDNLFQLADTYIYRAEDNYIVTGANSTTPIRRSLQERLDDRVSIRSFGAKGDGIQISTAQLQRAIDQLYINDANKTNPQSRAVLHLEPGIYIIDDTITIPAYATIVGAGKDKTIIRQNDAGSAVFRTVNTSSTPGNPATVASTTTLNQATDIRLENMTIEVTNPGKAIILENCRNSMFRNLKIKGTWESVDPILTTDVALDMVSLSNEVETKENNFIDCDFEGFSYATVSDWDINNNDWNRCTFTNLGYGIVWGQNTSSSPGQLTGPSFNHIVHSEFRNINKQALWIINGEYNACDDCKFEFVGNDAGSEVQPEVPVIQYDQKGNKANRNYFARTKALISGSGLTDVPYIPEVAGTAFYDISFENSITFGRLNDTRLFRLPGVINQSFDIEYTMVSQNYQAVRSGTLTVIVNAYASPAEVQISDDFNFVGDENAYLDAVSFNTQARDADSDLTLDTIDVKVTSTMPIDDQTEFKFVIKAKKTDVI